MPVRVKSQIQKVPREITRVPGVLLQTQLLLPTAAQPMEIKARVAWAKPVQFGMTELGVTFDPADMGTQQKIDSAVEHFLRKDKR